MIRVFEQRLNSPAVAVLFTAVVYAVFLLARLAMHQFDAGYFIHAGDAFCDPDHVPAGLPVRHNSTGYDGQFYYRLALDPFTRNRTDFGIMLDIPAHRQQRIIYPLLAYLFSLGKPHVVPWSLIMVNYVGLCVLAGFAALYLKSRGRHALWGLLIACYPGLVLSLARDLVEITALCFSLAGLWCTSKQWHGRAALLLTFAVLSRETALLIPLALLAARTYALWGKQGDRWYQGAVYGAPLVVYLFWQWMLHRNWGISGLAQNSGLLAPPFAGLFRLMQAAAPLSTLHQRVYAAELAITLLFSVYVSITYRSSSALLHEKLAWLFYLALVVSLPYSQIWLDDWNFLRAMTEYHLFGVLILAGGKLRALIIGSFGWILLWIYQFTLRTDVVRLLLE